MTSSNGGDDEQSHVFQQFFWYLSTYLDMKLMHHFLHLHSLISNTFKCGVIWDYTMFMWRYRNEIMVCHLLYTKP